MNNKLILLLSLGCAIIAFKAGIDAYTLSIIANENKWKQFGQYHPFFKNDKHPDPQCKHINLALNSSKTIIKIYPDSRTSINNAKGLIKKYTKTHPNLFAVINRSYMDGQTNFTGYSYTAKHKISNKMSPSSEVDLTTANLLMSCNSSNASQVSEFNLLNPTRQKHELIEAYYKSRGSKLKLAYEVLDSNDKLIEAKYKLK